MAARLTLISRGADRELDAIRQVVEMHDSVGGLYEMIALMEARCNRSCRVGLVDIVGHSSHGFLRMGTWAIDDSPQTAASISELLRPSLQQLGVCTIRLLGCSTATTSRGRDAMGRIARVSGCRVLGTKRYIGRHDFGPSGFISNDALLDAVAGRADGAWVTW